MTRLHQTHGQVKQIRALPATPGPGPRDPIVQRQQHTTVYVYGDQGLTPHFSPIAPSLPDPWPSRSRDALRLPAGQGAKCLPGLQASLCSRANVAFSP